MAVAPSVLTLAHVNHTATIEVGDDVVRLTFGYPPRNPVSRLHRHPLQDERATVLSGEFGFWKNGQVYRVKGGDESLAIHHGEWHAFWVEGAGPHKLQLELSPPLRTGRFFWRWFHAYPSALDKNTGFPNTLRGALLAALHSREFEFVHPWLMPFVRLLGVFVDDRERGAASQVILAFLGFGAILAALVVLLIRVASTVCKAVVADPTASPAARVCTDNLFLADWPGMTLLQTPESAMAIYTGLLLVGIALVGLWRVNGLRKETLEGTGPVPQRERAARNLWKRVWWEGTNFFPGGLRVLFLIPLTLTVWLGIVRAASVVWYKIRSEDVTDLLQNPWTLGTLLIISLWIGWMVLWPGEPEDESYKLSREERDDFINNVRGAAIAKVREEYDPKVNGIEDWLKKTEPFLVDVDGKLRELTKRVDALQKPVP